MPHTHKTSLWWGPPKNFADRKNERKISWLELFYDLVYVAAISQLTHHFAVHPTWRNLVFLFLLFSMIFWSWVNGSQYYDLHGNDSIRTRMLTFWQMLAVAAVAITIGDAFEGHHKSFAITFAILQTIINYLWWSVGFFDPGHRVFSKFYTINYTIAFLLLLISIFTSYDVAIVLWIIVLILNLTPPLTGARTIVRVLRESGQVFTASAALVERFGLFTIIVLAESILGTVSGIVTVRDKHPVEWFAFILAILVSFLLWSIYFDMTSGQETKKGYSYMLWLIGLHYPMLASYGVLGACINVLLADTTTGGNSTVKWMFCLAIAVILFTITGTARIMEEDDEDRAYIKPVSRLLIVTGAVMLLVPLFSAYLNTLSFLAVIALILLIPVFIGVRSWVRYKFFSSR
jgi:low temperature requirement protein LtrA